MVVAVYEFGVVVLVRVPVVVVLPRAERVIRVMVRDVVVVVSVSPRGVGMLRLLAVTFGVLAAIGGSRLHLGFPPLADSGRSRASLAYARDGPVVATGQLIQWKNRAG